MAETITLPMLAAGICATELLPVLDATAEAGMPLAFYSLSRIINDRIYPHIVRDETYDEIEIRRGLLVLAATALLMIAAKDRATERNQSNG